MEIPQSFAQFLTWLGTNGAFSTVIAIVLERWPGWATMKSDTKSFITLAVAILLGLASYALVRWVPAGVVNELEPWYQVIVGAVTIYLGSQYAHSTFKRRIATARYKQLGSSASRSEQLFEGGDVPLTDPQAVEQRWPGSGLG